MTYWANGSVKDKNITGPFTSLDILAGSVQVGAQAKDVVKAMGVSKLLGRLPTLSTKAETTLGVDAFALDPVLVGADINSPHYGIWGLNAVGSDEIKAQQEHPERGAAPWGYYMLLYSDMPTAEQWVKSGNWTPGAEDQIKTYKPELWEQIRVLKGFPPSNVVTAKLPPGLDEGSKMGIVDRGLMEFSVNGAIIWAAKTPDESAANKTGNPHPGASIINPGQWESVTGGKKPEEVFDFSEEIERGWQGLEGLRVLAYDKGDKAPHPAQEEIWSVIEAAEDGHEGARKALKYIGITGPEAKGLKAQATSWLDSIFS